MRCPHGMVHPDDCRRCQEADRAISEELVSLLEELLDLEGPQPGNADWANRVKQVIAKARGGS